jgi:hypothetical protein
MRREEQARGMKGKIFERFSNVFDLGLHQAQLVDAQP